MIIKNASITIIVKDLDKSIPFYELIGLSIKNRCGNHFAQLTAPSILIGLHQTNSKNLTKNSGNVSIGFTTNNFEEAKSDLQKLSVHTTDRQEEDGQFLHFIDPDGTALYFVKPKWKL